MRILSALVLITAVISVRAMDKKELQKLFAGATITRTFDDHYRPSGDARTSFIATLANGEKITATESQLGNHSIETTPPTTTPATKKIQTDYIKKMQQTTLNF